MLVRFPDPEFAEAFRAYMNYLEDLAGTIGGLYVAPSVAEGVHGSVLARPQVSRIQRRSLPPERRKALDAAMRKSWGTLRRLDREVEDPFTFDEEANAWLPSLAYYAVYHALVAYAVASSLPPLKDHASALKLGGQLVGRGWFPPPWDAACSGCPQTGSASFSGVSPSPMPVSSLTSPDPATAGDRLAMFLRTTRAKELDRRFAQERSRGVAPGRSRRNLAPADKERIAAAMAPTTVFDILWRLRKKANYDDADTFVLGAADELEARRLGQAIVIVADATVAAIEAISAACVGPDVLAEMTRAYALKCSARTGSAFAVRVESWDRRRTSTRSVPAPGRV